MDKYLFGSIGVLLFFIAGIGFYSATQHPQEVANIPSAAVGAVSEAVEDVTKPLDNSNDNPVVKSPENTSAVVSDDDDDERDDDDESVRTVSPQTTSPKETSGTFTMGQVKTHNSGTSCYSVVNGSVYDLTQWIGKHPGGASAILSLCGKDGTQAFEQKHGGERRPESELASLKIGVLAQ